MLELIDFFQQKAISFGAENTDKYTLEQIIELIEMGVTFADERGINLDESTGILELIEMGVTFADERGIDK